jgi:putative transposase
VVGISNSLYRYAPDDRRAVLEIAALQVAVDRYPAYGFSKLEPQARVPGVLPAEPQYWQSIRTTNQIESTFATIRHRTKRSKGCLFRDGMLNMMFKLGQCAEKQWRRLRVFDYLAKAITGVRFKDGIEVTEVDQVAA